MALLTSFLWKGVELNDGNVYGVPLADLALDDPNPADASWAYRKSATPVQTKLEIKEGVFTLNIHIIARHGETAAQYQAKIDQLRAIFDTRDPGFYQLQRKMPHEQTYRYLLAAPREMAINRLERKVAVTFQTADKTWQDAALQTATITLFDTAARTETLNIAYSGNFAAEPTITIKALTAGSDGPVPLYYRDVVVYAVGTGGAGYVVGNPVQVVTGWDTSALVTAGKMRSDGLDITVGLTDGTKFRRYVGGAQNSRKLWILPHTWPAYASGSLVFGPGAGSGTQTALTATDTVMYLSMQGIDAWPTNGKLMLDNEVITFSGVTVISQAGTSQQLKLNIIQRGADGTAAAAHTLYTPPKRPVTVRVSYGYAAGFPTAIYNDLNGWPLIDYETSTNAQWNQTDTYDPNPTNRPWVWRPDSDPKAVRAGERVVAAAESQTKLALYGTYQTGTPVAHQRLILPVPGYAARTLDYIRLVLTLKGGAGAYPGVTVKLCKLKRGYGTAYEEIVELWSYTYSSSAEAQIDTGWVFTDQRWTQGTHYFLRLENAAPGAQVRNVRIDEFDAKLDQDYWTYYPIAGALGAEGGASVGEYPVYVTVSNPSDTSNPQAFSVTTRMATNQTVTVDAGERSVSGMNLSEVSYQNPTWLRLVPGNNVLTFTGPTGAGQMLVTIQWRERY